MNEHDGMDDLRALIREVIRDQLSLISETESVETVNLLTDADLTAFAVRLADLDEQDRQDIRTGRKRFRLAAGSRAASPPGPTPGPAAAPPGPAASPPGPAAGPAVRRIGKGAVTEKVIKDAARAGQRLVLGPGAVLTPLARERARSSGVQIEKER